MWKIVLSIFFVFDAFAKEAPIYIELKDYGRHQKYSKLQSFELMPRQDKNQTLYSIRNRKFNKNILFKPVTQEITHLLGYKNNVLPSCRQGTRFSINYMNKSKTIYLCTSPFLNNKLNKKIRRWITFLRR
tara:strand:- start:9474 stop:9863 length:390 start_codon:yes stop_codon:yes gene_type:complete